MPKLSIIIPCLNEEHYIGLTLESLVLQQDECTLQVIVVDGHSADATLSVIRSFSDKLHDLVIVEGERGISRQRNLGATHARYEHILFLDSDIILPEHFIEKITKKISGLGDCFITLVTHLPYHGNIADYLFVSVLMSFVSFMQFIDPVCSGSFILTTKKTHETIAGFDEKIVMAEDVDYGRRARKFGARYKLFYTPFVWASPRRLHKTGRLRLLWQWTKGYLHTVFVGPMYENKLFTYTFGDYKKK